MSECADLPTTATPPAKVVLNTAHARAMLRNRFAPGEWALMQEVAPSTGGGTRYADAVAVNLWKSRGHAIHGFEIKVSRSDWLRELKQPAKAEDVYSYCNHWWIVAPAGVVNDGELPPNWGLLELNAKGLRQVVAAPRLTPQPISIGFFASLMRRGSEALDAEVVSRTREDRERILASAQEQCDRMVEQKAAQRTHSIERATVALQEVKAATGLDFLATGHYRGPSIDMLKLAQRREALNGYGPDALLGRLTEMSDELERAGQRVRAAVEALVAAPPLPQSVDG
jgi:hypothetical protein